MDHQKVIREALIHHGFTPEGADALIVQHNAWQADLARHQTLKRFREYAGRLWTPAIIPHVRALIESLDPFEPNGAGLRRKINGEPVPAALLNRQEKQDHGT